MRKKIEGIILSKREHRERDLVTSVLLRSGEKIPLVFYGHRGGSKQRGTILEIGNQLKAEIKKGPSADGLYVTEEYTIGWHHKKIREIPRCFFDLCFYLEFIQKVSLTVDDDVKDVDGELYRLLSNTVFYLDEIGDNHNLLHKLRSIFLARIAMSEGVLPALNECPLCSSSLSKDNPVSLSFSEGGFVCSQCREKTEHSDQDLFRFLNYAAFNPIKNYKDFPSIDETAWQKFFNYLLYQFDWRREEFKTISSL